jgi:hypothetical protein
MTNTRGVLRGLVLVAFSIVTTHAATYTATSCNQSDVNAVINGPNHTAVTGDTIIIPAGSCTWSRALNVPAGITLMGVRSGGAPSGVTITDTNPNGSEVGRCGSYTLICMNLDPNFHTTLANLNFVTGSGVGAGDYVVFQGTGAVPLMHDMDFNVPYFILGHAVQWLVTGGVIWNTTFESTSNLNGSCGENIGGGPTIVFKAQKPWDDPDTMGMNDATGTNNTYIEDSTFSNVGQAPDVDDNARVVIRHTTFTNSGGLNHGATSATGARYAEFYNNTFQVTNRNIDLSGRYFWFRGGTAVITNNSIGGIDTAPCHANGTSFQFTVESATRSTDHGCCLGYACWHQPGSGSSGVSGSCSSTSSCLDGSQTPSDTYQTLDPVYIWNNSGTGASASRIFGTTDEIGSGCSTGNTTNTFFVSGRDYSIDASGSPTSGAKPGWVPYTYPHPLRSPSSPAPPSPPTNVATVVQ